MQFKNAIIAASAMAGVALAQTNGFSIATPQTLVQCQPYQIGITGGTPPFNIRVTEQGNTSNVIETLAQTSSRQVTWNVNIRSGTVITLYVVDSTGQGVASAPSNSIGPGSDSCLNSSASVSEGSTAAAGGSGSGSSSGAAPSSTAGGNSPTSTSAGGNGNTRTSSGTAPAASTSAPANGAGQLSGYSAAVAGAVGVVVAALF